MNKILSKDQYELLNVSGECETKKIKTITHLAELKLVDITSIVGEHLPTKIKYIVTESGVEAARHSKESKKQRRHN